MQSPLPRRRLLAWLAATAAAGLPVLGCSRPRASTRGDQKLGTLGKTRDEWRALLPRPVYLVMFEEDTEFAFSSPLNHEKREGTYVCAACSNPLFESAAKFDSGTGWPSFFRPIPARLGTKADYSFGVTRTEYHCLRCGGHQGHVFDDGPPPTGQRWCNNGVALQFVPRGTELPPLRQ